MSDGIRAGALCSLFLTSLASLAWAGEADAPRRIFVAPHARPEDEPGLGRAAAMNAAMDRVARHVEACRRDGSMAALLPGLDVLRPYLDSRPAERAAILRLLRAGRLETSGALAPACERLAGGEALIRALVASQLYHRRVLGVSADARLASELFGSSPQLSQLLAKAGYKGCFWTGSGAGASAVFWHLSPGGARLLHCRVAEWRRPSSLDELRRLVTGGLAAQEALGLPADFHLVAPGPAGPLPFLAHSMAKLRASGPPVVLGGPKAYLKAILPRASDPASRVPTVSRLFETRHAGAAVSRVELKIANRLCENAVLDAERLATIALLVGAEYPELALDKAWRLILAAQRPAGIGGTGGQAAYLDTLAAYREALELATGVLGRSLRYLGRAANTTTRPGIPIAVFNPLSWKRADACRVSLDLRGLRTRGLALVDDAGKAVPFEVLRLTKSSAGMLEEARLLFVAADVPPVGFRLFHAMPGNSLPTPSVTEEAPVGNIENEFFRVSADAAFGGGIVRILDKRSGRELLRRVAGRVGNELAVLREQRGRKSGARELWTTGPVVLSSRQPTRLEVRSGPVAMTIAAVGKVGGRCRRRQTITVYRGVPRIDCVTTLTYGGSDDLIVVTFPLGHPGAVPLVDDRFCVQTGRRSRQALDYRTGSAIPPSGCRIYAAGRWAGFGASVRVAFTDREGRILASFHLGPSAIVHRDDAEGRKAAVFLQRILAPRGIPCTTVRDTVDPASIGARFRLVLAVGDGNAYASRLLATLDEAARSGLKARAKSRGHALAVFRDVAVPAGRRPATVLLVLAPTAELLDKALQDIAASIETTTGFAVPAEANFAGIRTTAPDAGVALLNQGTLAHSFEPDGGLTLLLMRTAPWPSQALGRPLVPEQGVRVFRYALYPHAADWREAAVHRAALEFNHPLLPLVLDRHDGPLAAPTSFVSVEPDNVVLSALKPAGFRLVIGGTRKPTEPRGVILRLYEAYGEGPSEARIRFFAPIQKAWRTSLLEERGQAIEAAGGELALKLGAASVHTVEILLGKSPAHLSAASLDTAAEPVQPVATRYWLTGLAAPMGNQPVAITLTGRPRIGQIVHVRVAVANNTDARLTGTAWITAPKLWDVTPRRFDYRVRPRGHVERTVRVAVPTGTRGGLLAALTQHNGQTLRDAVAAGPYRPLTVAVQRSATQILARIRNPNPFAVSGRAEVVTGIEAWPRALVGPYSRWSVEPRVQGFTVAANAEAAVSFAIEPAAPQAWQESFWAVVKLAYDGHVAYAAEPPP